MEEEMALAVEVRKGHRLGNARGPYMLLTAGNQLTDTLTVTSDCQTLIC